MRMFSLMPASRLARDLQGVSAIEFGLLAPLLAFITLGITDCANGLARKFRIEQATYRTLELVTMSRNTISSADLATEASAAAGEPLSNVKVHRWLECDDKPFSDSLNCAAAEQTARFVQVTVFSDFEPRFRYGLLGTAAGANANGTIRITARSTVRVQ